MTPKKSGQSAKTRIFYPSFAFKIFESVRKAKLPFFSLGIFLAPPTYRGLTDRDLSDGLTLSGIKVCPHIFDRPLIDVERRSVDYIWTQRPPDWYTENELLPLLLTTRHGFSVQCIKADQNQKAAGQWPPEEINNATGLVSRLPALIQTQDRSQYETFMIYFI
jgi:hypothetical protein